MREINIIIRYDVFVPTNHTYVYSSELRGNIETLPDYVWIIQKPIRLENWPSYLSYSRVVAEPLFLAFF